MSDKTKYRITQIEITFSRGSFADWAETSEPQTAADIERWEAAYNEQCVKTIAEGFPYASVEVGEGPDQIMYSKYDIEFQETTGPFDYSLDATDADYHQDELHEIARGDIGSILQDVSNDGSFWNK